MFDISFAELITIFLVIIVFIAPKNIPILARGAGKATKKIRILQLVIKKKSTLLAKKAY